MNTKKPNLPVSHTDTTPKESEWKLMKTIAARMLQSGFLPSHIKNENQALMIMLTGREMGIPPTMSLRSLYVIDQKVGMSAQLMMAQVKKSGIGKFTITANDDKATVKAERLDTGDTYTSEWTREQAKKAGLAMRQNWQRYPKQMLVNRAISEVCRFLFPDLLANIYTEEEIESLDHKPEPIKQDIGDTTTTTKAPADYDTEIDGLDPGLVKTIKIKQKKLNLPDDEYRKFLEKNWGVDSCTKLNKTQAIECITALNDLVDEMAKTQALTQDPEVTVVDTETDDEDNTEPLDNTQEWVKKYSELTIEEIQKKIKTLRTMLGWDAEQIKEFLNRFAGKSVSSFLKDDWVEAAVELERQLKEQTNGDTREEPEELIPF